jgi:acetylornithine deacetylase/succinyl-diaminopimelate desuccinylase-like protein
MNVDADRLRDLTLELVRCESPTGDTADVARLYARRLAEIGLEFRALLAPIAAETGCTIELDLRLVRDSYRIDPEERLAVALREAYREVTGHEQPLIGMKVVADGAVFHQAGIPTVYHGPVGTGAHADVETMAVPELVRATEVYLALLQRLWA